MPYLLNLVYLSFLVALSPWLLYKALTTGKYRRGLWQKLSGTAALRQTHSPCVWFHGVSVGEVHMLRALVRQFRQRHPDWECVISSTTDTGFDEARKSFPDLPVVFWPFDFTWAVRRALRRVNPALVVLAESELWWNFLRAAEERGVPVAVVNGRMSPRSFRRWGLLLGRVGTGKAFWARLIRPVLRTMLGRVSLWAVQSEAYAERYCGLGMNVGRVHITGNIKYDGVEGDRANGRTQVLRGLFGIGPDDLVWVAGSTQAPEEAVALDVYQRLRVECPRLRLVLVPRQKDRFDEVARLLERSGLPFVRRGTLRGPAQGGHVVLVDSIGELGAVWGLADVAFVGGSLDGQRGGQNMIEPAAYGAAVVFGPHVWNFRDAVDRLLGAGAALQVQDATELGAVVRRLLADGDERERLGRAARQLVAGQQGATRKTVDLLERLLAQRDADRVRPAA